jgi:hypothetical protein
MAKPSKITLKIETRLTPDGDSIPYELTYNDETFEVKNLVKSMKLFNGAVRWKCSIDGRSIEMFNEGNKWWMVRN